MKILEPIRLIETYMLRCQCRPEKVKQIHSLKTVCLTETFINIFFLKTHFFCLLQRKGFAFYSIVSTYYVIENLLKNIV